MGRVTYAHLTYRQLEALSNRYARIFRDGGIRKGTLTLMFLRPGLDFIAAVFGVFKTGGVPVLIDPGMGKANLLSCIRQTEPEAMVAIPLVHYLRFLYRSSFRSVRTAFSLGSPAAPGCIRLESARHMTDSDFPIEATSPDDEAAILFTTGSTGPPKGVVTTHGIFMAQTELIRNVYGAGPDEVDLPGFPLFALFSVALGMTCVIPDMDPTRPAQVNPKRIIEAVENHGVTFSFGSPALWRTVSRHCIERNIRMPSLRKVLMAGAPVPAKLHRQVLDIIAPNGETMIPYGATEALPITTFTGSEMLTETAMLTETGRGTCVGRPLPGIDIRIIEAIDGEIANWTETKELPAFEIGEITVSGPVVTSAYHRLEHHTRMAKIRGSDGRVWHRMGDVGYIDDQGRVWFCGRKSHRVMTEQRIYYSVCCEAIFNAHPDVFRTALVSIPDGKEGTARKPALVFEPLPGRMPKGTAKLENMIAELAELGSKHEFTRDIATFLVHPSFPVDIRHNAKISREKLSEWASRIIRI
jgi:acyl-CoA synthetase (AMP-forming)/AMP-acid ligase II